MISELNNPPGWLNLFDGACAAVATIAAVYVAVRDSRWRRSGLAKQLEDRIGAAQKTADEWDKSPAALKLRGDVERHGRKLGEHDDALKHVATAKDVSDLNGKITTATAEIRHAREGVDRIEGILIKQALHNRTGA